MPLRKFLPYDIVGAGLWSALFVMLGYVFWRSIDTVTEYVGRGLFVFGLARRARRRRRSTSGASPATRRSAPARGTGSSATRPVRRGRRAPSGRSSGRAAGPARFVYERLTPGDLGLELTTLLAIAAVGGFGFFAMAEALSTTAPTAAGRRPRVRHRRRAAGVATVRRVVAVLTDLGSLPVTGAVIARDRGLGGSPRAGRSTPPRWSPGSTLTVVAVHVAKDVEGRDRARWRRSCATSGLSYPSGHAAYAVAFVACAVVLVRGGSSLAVRFAAVTVAVGVMVFVALSRIYLRAHFLSDVLGGVGLAAAVFSLVGIVAIVVAHVRHNAGP